MNRRNFLQRAAFGTRLFLPAGRKPCYLWDRALVLASAKIAKNRSEQVPPRRRVETYLAYSSSRRSIASSKKSNKKGTMCQLPTFTECWIRFSRISFTNAEGCMVRLTSHAHNQHASTKKETNGKDSTFSSDWWT